MKFQWVLGGAFILAGVAQFALPTTFLDRAYVLSDTATDDLNLILALGVLLIGTGFAVLSEPLDDTFTRRSSALVIASVFAVAYFLMLALHLREWWIDDAGITFAYSRSLSEGLGLVAQPWLPPEEGYSSSTWMLLLSAAGRLGFDIPLAAKFLGISFSAFCTIICAIILARETRSPLSIIVSSAGISCSSTVVWAASGQEHALQALLLLLIVFCVWLSEHWRWPVAILLALFVLTRPEAPIIVIGVFIAAVFLTWRSGGKLVNAADIAVALVPFLAFVALLGFRMLYFGDLLPNPYYAKSSAAGLIGLLNIMGLGWSYVVSGLRETALLLLLPLVFAHRIKTVAPWLVVTLAILCAQLFFVVWAKGDWMAQYRFLMPIIPIIALLAALGLRGLGSFQARALCGVLAVLVLVQTNAQALARFKEHPTTPMSAVTEVGQAFKALADRLQIEDPVLAHHDAGGIAYHRTIRLVDLGGLINRTIAKNMYDKDFMTRYLLEDVRPDFFFGARNFAIASGFSDTLLFERDYVRIDFIGQPRVRSYLTHMRRDLFVPGHGIEGEYDNAGNLVRVRVAPAN